MSVLPPITPPVTPGGAIGFDPGGQAGGIGAPGGQAAATGSPTRPTRPTPGSIGPIMTRLPELQRSLDRKYASPGDYDDSGVLAPAMGGASPLALAALRRLDQQRVSRGQPLITSTPSALGLQAATAMRPVLPEPDQPFVLDAITDIADIARGLPHLPFTIFSDIKALPQSLNSLSDAMAPGGLEGLGNVANLPGFRLLPGSFILGSFGTEMPGASNLLDHPIFTLLDASPFASRAARATNTFRTVESVMNEQAAALGAAAPRLHPVRTVLRNYRPGGPAVSNVADLRGSLIDQFGVNRGATPPRGFGNLSLTDPANPPAPVAGRVVEPNLYGQAMQSMGAAYRRTPMGRWTTEAFSRQARVPSERSVYWSSYITNPDRARTISPEAATWFQRAADLGRQTNILPEREAQIIDALVTGDIQFTGPNPSDFTQRGVLSSLTPEEAVYLHTIDQGQTALRQSLIDRGELVEVQFPHGVEYYDAATANRILRARYQRDVAGWFEGRFAELRDGTYGSPGDYWREIDSILADPQLTAKQRITAVNLNLRALEHMNIPGAQQFRQGWDNARTVAERNNWIASYRQAGMDAFDNATPNPIPDTIITDTVNDLRAAASNPSLPLARDLRNYLRRGDWQAARATVTKMMGTQRYANLITSPLDDLHNALGQRMFIDGQGKSRVPLADRISRISRSHQQLARTAEAIEARHPAARWDDVIRSRARTNIADFVRDEGFNRGLTQETIDTTLDHIANDLYTVAGDAFGDRAYMESIVRKFRADAARSWRTLAEQGIEPRYVHRVSPQRAQRMMNPRVFDSPNLGLSSIRERLWERSPTVSNLAISLQHQAYEILNREASLSFANEMGQWFGVSGAELQARYTRAVDIAAQANPLLDRAAHMRELIERDWTPYDPGAFLRGKTDTPRSSTAGEQIYVPRAVASTLERMRPILPSTFERGMAPVMSVFRTSLLPLSPRWHLYNILGGAIMLQSSTGIGVWRFWRQARELARHQGEELGLLEEGANAMPPGGNMRGNQEWARTTRLNDRGNVATAHSVAAGHTLGRLWRQIQDARRDGLLGDAINRGQDLIQRSYDFNQWVDNMYRSMAFLYGRDRALTRGMSPAQAIDEGMRLSRDILQSWDQITPIERSILRVAAPFYGWLSHLLKFTVKNFPHDHPWRLAVISRVAETELSDYASGLPPRFASLFMPFGMDEDGNTTAINLDGANPFRDVANYASLVGFMLGQKGGSLAAVTQNINPLFSAPLKAAGFDVAEGVPELYPELVYDPTTGQLTVQPKESLPKSLITSILPQTRLLDMLSGQNAEFRELMKSNPQAALSQLRSSVGLPVLTRNVNVPEELIKSEVTKYEDMGRARSAALRTGNLDLLDAYPSLRAYRTQIEQLARTGQLDQYRTNVQFESNEPGLTDLLLDVANPAAAYKRQSAELARQ